MWIASKIINFATGMPRRLRVPQINTMENQSGFHTFTLPNGLRCVHASACGRAMYAGLVVGAGSRDEAPALDGLAHFVEHTLFKGTERRRAWQINSRMESVGGDLNAYTTKEETLLYTSAPLGHTARALDLMADLVAGSSFPLSEVDRERGVVIDEINSYLDSPDEAVFDEFEELLYAGSRMAHNILGTADSVRTLRPEDCRSFLDRYYTPANMALYIVDELSHARAEALACRYFGALHYPAPEPRRVRPDIPSPFREVRDRGGHQAHTVAGVRLFGRDDPRRYALLMLNNYLGGPSMNSRLNTEMREKRGLVYTVESSVALMSDCGSLQIYFGCDPDDTRRCLHIASREIERLASSVMPPRKFEAVRRQYLGQLAVSTEHRESMAAALGKSLLYYNRIVDAATMAENIRSVTSEEFRGVAALIAERGLSSLTLM